jgi:dienelactone hydrolase
VATRQTPQAAGVTATELRVPADGVYGRVFRPKDNSTRRPALLVFGGSEGGLRPAVVLKAALLAAHGYPTLALAYWKAPGLPQNLSRIPLEYFRKALAVLRPTRCRSLPCPGHRRVLGRRRQPARGRDLP